MTPVEELDAVYRAAEMHVDELRQAVRYSELTQLHLDHDDLLLDMVRASTAVLRAFLDRAEIDRDKAAEAVKVAWEAEQEKKI